MGKKGPRHGSLAFWHRARASRIVPRIRRWGNNSRGLEGFVGFKVGMTHVVVVDDSESPTKGQEVVKPVTVVEVPPVFVYSIVGYKRDAVEGLKVVAEVPFTNLPKEARLMVCTPKKRRKSLEDLANVNGLDDVRVRAFAQPWRTVVGKKRSELFELALGGSGVVEKIAQSKELLGKEVSVSQVFSEGSVVDVIGVTKGFGWQGVVKRFGVALNTRKASKARRHGGSIGAERQAKVMYTIPRAGQTGFHRRTVRANRILGVFSDSKVVCENAFPAYGKIKNDFLIVEGSLPGPRKRMLFLRKTLRDFGSKKPVIKLVVTRKAH